MNDYDKYKNSVVGVVEQILGELPDKLESVNSLLSGFDPSKLNMIQEVMTNLGGSPAAITSEVLGRE